jgi:D-arabinose 1-dehydrogenase-like Zn-dependent alcohol dehydrogenase
VLGRLFLDIVQGRHSHIHRSSLNDINQVFADLAAGTVDGRIVLDMSS